MTCMTLDCVKPTQFCVIQSTHCNVGLKCFFFQFYQNVYYYCNFVMHAYFIDISQGSVEMYFWCTVGSIIITLLQIFCSVPVKEF